MITKKCSKCSRVRLLKFFPKDRRYHLGVSCWCKNCFSSYNKKPNRKKANSRRWKKYISNPKNRERERKRSIRKYHRNPRKIKDQVMRRLFGISLVYFERTKRCLLCKRKVRLVADHDHETNRFRGAVCHTCNLMIAWVERISGGLDKIKRYLKRG